MLRMMKSARRVGKLHGVLLLTGLIAISVGRAKADPAASTAAESPAPALTSVMEAMKTERERLRSGVYEIRGTYSDEITNELGFSGTDKRRTGKVDVLGAFDSVRGFMLCARTVPSWSLHTSHVLHEARQAGLERPPPETRLIFCARPAATYLYLSLRRHLEIWPPDTKRMHLAEGWIDMRAFGLAEPFSDLKTEEIYNRKFIRRTPEVSTEANGLTLCTWHIGDAERHQCWIDTKQGFAPIRFIGRARVPERGETEWRKPHLDRKIEWEKKRGVWVPVSYRQLYIKELPPAKPPEPPKYEYTPTYQVMEQVWKIDWRWINEPVSDASFDYQQFDLPADTQILDFRSK